MSPENVRDFQDWNGPWGQNAFICRNYAKPCAMRLVDHHRGRRTKAHKLVDLLQSLYTGTTASVKGLKSTFETQAGCRQSDVESCCCFNYYLVWCQKVAAVQIDAGWVSERIWQCVLSTKHQTTAPTKSPEMAKLESSWNNFLWKMIRGGFSKKTQNQDNFTFKYSRSDCDGIVGTPPPHDFIESQNLKYTAHTCRHPNDSLTKHILFARPQRN